jgi:MFS family permease
MPFHVEKHAACDKISTMRSVDTGFKGPIARLFRLTPLIPPRAIVFFCLSTFLYWSSLYLFVPGLPVHAKNMGANLSMVGAVVASFAIAQMLLRIPLGVWADKLGRQKPFMVAGFVTAAMGTLLMGLAQDPWVLFAGRAITGISAAAWVAFTVFFSGCFPRTQITQAMGLIMALNSISQVSASLFGGYAAQLWDWRTTFFIATALAVAALPLFLFLPETSSKPSNRSSCRDVVSMPRLPFLLSVSAICVLGQFVVHGASLGFLPVYGERMGASEAELGYLITALFAASSLGSMAILRLVDRMGHSATLAVAFLMMSSALVGVPFIHRIPLLIMIQIPVGLGRGIFFALLLSLSTYGVPSSKMTTAMGIFQCLYAGGMFLGPFLLGFIATGFGLNTVFYVSAIIAAVGAVLSCAPAIRRL